VRRIHTVADQGMAAVAIADGDAFSPVPAADSATSTATTSAPAAAGRGIRGAHLHPSLIAAMSPSGGVAEQYRALRTRIVHSEGGGPLHAVLITSPGRGDGKSLSVANPGLAMGLDFTQ